MQDVKIERVRLRAANSYLVMGEKTIIVDTGDPGYSEGILKAIKRHHLKKVDISLIFITHGHVDHFGSVYELKRKLDVPVVMQENDVPYLVDGVQAPLYPINGLAKAIKRIGKDLHVKERYDLVPDYTFDEELDLQPFGIKGKLLATPGHTLGSASLVLVDGRAVTGDLLIRKHFLSGEPLAPAFLHDFGLFKASMKKLQDEGVHTYYPGHGKAISKKEIRFAV
ncbi:MAG: MBL fold metallo-hydrolase [Bacillota bacterium]|nr:MBL fold metallo-hydrolase [Bacillota bacterium]